MFHHHLGKIIKISLIFYSFSKLLHSQKLYSFDSIIQTCFFFLFSRNAQRTNGGMPSPPRRSRSPPTIARQTVEEVVEVASTEDPISSPAATQSHNVEIEEVSISYDISSPSISTSGPEPVITEQEIEEPSEEASNDPKSPMFTELPTV